MKKNDVNRRDFIKSVGLGAAALGLTEKHLLGQGLNSSVKASISIDPKPKFELSPYLYMQFMEPLGVTDTSVDAAWDFARDCWREDLIEVTQELAPSLMRWGGCFCSYYRWKEGVGPMDQRKPMLNQLWGGIYNNQVGTHEFVDICKRVGADPLMVVNFESDGRERWATSPKGRDRFGTAKEAGEWVDYCNNPSNALRREHGVNDPYKIKMWQVGNETSYEGILTAETAAQKTIEFAKTMRKADPSIDIIGWGDTGWAPRMLEIAGEHLQYISFHNGFRSGGEGSPLHGIEYRKNPARTWEYFMKTYKEQEARIQGMREQVAKYNVPLAMTECHYVLSGRNRCEALSTWAAGVANARMLNVHERNGDILKIATLADYCGTRWQNNAVMIPVPWGKSFMMPVAMVMSLYRKHSGEQAVDMLDAPADLDVTASRTGNRLFLHVINTNRTQPVKASFQVKGEKLAKGRAFWFDLDPELEVFEYRPECIFPKEKDLDLTTAWTFPAASVSAVELTLEAA